MKNFTIKTEIPLENVYNLLVSALEGGSNYWYMIVKATRPKKHTFEDKIWASERAADESYLNQCEIPFNEGGALFINDECADDPTLQKPVRLDLKSMQKGLELMSQWEIKHHWANFVKDDADAETADVFLQFCIFGEVIYG